MGRRLHGPFEIGGSVTDAATISVTGGSDPPAPTGDVKFFVCGTPATSCATTGTAFDTKPLSGAVKNGKDYTVTSTAYTPTTAGTYCFAASWPGDLNYKPDSPATEFRDNGMNECFTVTPRMPTISTSQTPTTDQPLGTATSDTATIGNTAPKPNGSPANGTVQFKLYGPRATPGTANCTANLVYTSAAYTVSGNGTYPTGQHTPATFTPTLAGTYDWQATYSGDPPNTSGPISSICGDEPVTFLQLQPSMTTQQRFRPNDSATVTVSSAAAGDLAGNVRFQLFVNSATCSGAAAYDSGNIAISSGSGTGTSRTVSTSNTTEYVTSGTTFSWLVTYASTNTGHKNVTATCNAENSSLTINNGGTFNMP